MGLVVTGMGMDTLNLVGKLAGMKQGESLTFQRQDHQFRDGGMHKAEASPHHQQYLLGRDLAMLCGDKRGIPAGF